MADKVFGIDFTNESNPLAAYTLSVHNGTALVDITLQDIIDLFSTTTYSPFRNVIINGDFKISQRGTSFAGLTGSAYNLDRWLATFSNLGTWTVSQDTDVPSGTVHRKSIKLLVTTADAAPAAADNAVLLTRLEGQHMQAFLKGTASAKQFVLSFRVKSSTTGTYIAEIRDTDNARHVCGSYTINAANTWETKTITFPADSTGVFDNDNANSFNLVFWLSAGSNFTSGTLASVWAAEVAANRAVGQTNLAASVNNYINFAGVQLEAGEATTFEWLPFEVDLFRCRRYYFKSFQYATAPAQNAGIAGCIRFMAGKAGATTEFTLTRYPVHMRTTPTVTTYNPSAANAQVRDSTAAADCSSTTVTATIGTEDAVGIHCTGNASTAVGNLLDVHITADAEL